MTDLETLALVFLLIYGWECACWIQRGSLVFSTRWGRRWSLDTPGTLLGNHRGGFLFAHPLPPLGDILTTSQQFLSMSPQGLLAFVPPPIIAGWRTPQSGEFIPFDEIKSTGCKGKTITINRKPFISASTAPAALQLESWIRKLCKLPKEKREEAIKQILKTTLDFKGARTRWNDFKQRTKALRILCNAFFVHLFLVIPTTIYLVGLRLSWLPLLTGLLCFSISISFRARRIHKELYPDAEDDRFTLFLTLLLSPTTTVRACDALSRPLLSHLHCLTSAKLFLPEKEFRSLAQQTWAALEHPILPAWEENQKQQAETEQHARKAFQQVLSKSLEKQGIPIDQLTLPPNPNDPSVTTYCPRCRAQFVQTEGSCPDCQQPVTLKPLEKK